MMSFYPSSPERVSHSLLPFFIFLKSINILPACVDERVGIVRNEYTIGPQSQPSSLRLNLGLAGFQYTLPDQSLEGADF